MDFRFQLLKVLGRLPSGAHRNFRRLAQTNKVATATMLNTHCAAPSDLPRVERGRLRRMKLAAHGTQISNFYPLQLAKIAPAVEYIAPSRKGQQFLRMALYIRDDVLFKAPLWSSRRLMVALRFFGQFVNSHRRIDTR